MNKIICLLLLAAPYTFFAQSSEKSRVLYGACTTDSLRSDPFAVWFNANYDGYVPSSTVTNELQKLNTNDLDIKIFFGTWCGDSKREVPRFLKLLSAFRFPENKIKLIALGGSDSLVKQSPGHEEAGLGIFRVPTFIIYQNGKEINRINEFPVYSLEKDLLAILTGKNYFPNYRSFGLVLYWLNDGIFTDDNISARGMAEQLRPLVAGEFELNSLAYLMLRQGKKKEALKLFQVNNNLYPESPNTTSSLGEAYLENGEQKKAVTALERALELNKDPKLIKEILVLLYKAKEKV
jgi:tetratricopeptide (TPR) repeat protein